MSEPADPFAIRRILVALDASPHSIAALEVAANLASAMEAELAGLFVEEEELLRMADAPSAREIAYPGESAPTSRSIMERKFRAQSEHLRTTLARVADRVQVRWSFQTVRGDVVSELLAAVSEHDIVAIGRHGWSLARQSRIGSKALELAASNIPLLLISERTALSNLRPLVYYDGSVASRNAVLVGARLAGAGKKSITVLVRAADSEKKATEIRTLLEGQSLDVRFQPIDLNEKMSLTRAVGSERAVMLVFAGRLLLKNRKAFEALLGEVEVPLLLLGDGFDQGEMEEPT